MKREYKKLKMQNEKSQHKSVLLDEAVGFLLPRSGGIYVDATIGGGGHAERILEDSGPDGRLIGIDVDPGMLEIAKKRLKRFGDRCFFVNNNYTELVSILHGFNIDRVDGIIFDLGVSTEHFTDPSRGFSVRRNGPLDMRFNQGIGLTAEEIVNEWKLDDLVRVFTDYGEERKARIIARYIIERRRGKRICTTGELAELVVRAVGGRRRKIHPATKIFQALRIAVNDELENIKKGLPIAVDVLKPGGRLCVISFHSLEDRIVKNVFRDLSGLSVRLITKKPVTPKREEIISNPSSRSAKLRVVERIYA